MPTAPQDTFPFCGQTYPAESVLVDSQRSVNLYPETALPSSKTQVALIGTPGLVLFANLPLGAVRAVWAGNSRLFAVGGTNFYEVSSVGAVIQNFGAMPGSLGFGPCQIVQGVGPSFTLLVMDPSVPNGVGGFGRIYHANPVGPSMDAVVDGKALEYLDGLFVAVATPTASIQNRIITSGNGITWPGLSFANRSGSNDLVTMIAVMNGQLWIFGEKTIEVWYNAGYSPFPFARIQGAALNYGLLARFSVAKIENRLMWLGADESGWPVVFQTAGMLPVRASNFAIETLIKSYGVGIHEARAYPYRESGHLFYVLNFDNGTIAYDVNTGMWHERAYLNPTTGLMERSLSDCLASVNTFDQSTFNFTGDYRNGRIYIQSLAYPADNNAPIRRVRTAPHVSNSDRWMTFPSLEIEADMGTAQIGLEISNNGGRSFPGSLPAVGASTDLSSDGFGRYVFRRLGRSRDRVFRATITDNSNLVRLIRANLNVIPGTGP